VLPVGAQSPDAMFVLEEVKVDTEVVTFTQLMDHIQAPVM